jgi:competence protein ComEA
MDRKKRIQLLLGLAVVMICGFLYFYTNAKDGVTDIVTEHFSDSTEQSDTSDKNEGNKTEEVSAQAEKIYIHVCGEVKNPGVYTFTSSPRVIEAVKKAGGFTKKADRQTINLAEEVADGTQLFIPAKKKNKASAAAETVNESGKININTATKQELMTLSGIGEAKAAQILSYREENGKFQKIEDIMNISGIKEGVFGKIKDQIEV